MSFGGASFMFGGSFPASSDGIRLVNSPPAHDGFQNNTNESCLSGDENALKASLATVNRLSDSNELSSGLGPHDAESSGNPAVYGLELGTKIYSIAECGSRLYYLRSDVGFNEGEACTLSWCQLRGSRERLLEKHDKTVKQDLNCFPMLSSKEFTQGVIRMSSDKRLSSLMVVSEHQIAVVRLPEYVHSGQRRDEIHGEIHKVGDDQWKVNLRSSSGCGFRISGALSNTKNGIELIGEFMEEAIEPNGCGYHGKLNLTGDTTNANYQDGVQLPIRSKQELRGTCQFRHGATVPVRTYCLLKVESVKPAKLPGTFRIDGKLCEALVEFVDPSYFSCHPDPVVDAQWHPVFDDQVLVLLKNGTLRVYGTSANGKDSLFDPISVTNVLIPPCSGFSCAAMSFGSTVACRDITSRCSFVALLRRLSVYILCSNGAIVSLSPAGALDRSQKYVDALETAAKEALSQVNLTHTKESSIHQDLLFHLKWIQALRDSPSMSINFAPLLVSPPCFEEAESNTRKAYGHDASRSLLASSLVALPAVNSPFVSLLRAWNTGYVDSLIFCTPLNSINYCIAQTSQGVNRNGLRLGFSGGKGVGEQSFLPASKVICERKDDRRDSPLKNLLTKLTSSSLEYQNVKECRKTDTPEKFMSKLRRTVTPVADKSRNSAEDLALSSEADSFHSRLLKMVECGVTGKHVGSTEVFPGKVISLIQSPVYDDMCVAFCKDSGLAYLIWAPWANMDDDKVEHAGRLLCRRVASNELELSHSVQPTIFSNSLTGHLLAFVVSLPREQDTPSFVASDLSSECVAIRSGLTESLAIEENQKRDNIDDDESLCSDSDLHELDALLAAYKTTLSRLTSVPSVLAKLKVTSHDTPPELSLALTSWLHKLSDGLLYGARDPQANTEHQTSKVDHSPGLLHNINMGMEFIEQKREEQNKIFEMQMKALELVQEDFEKARSGTSTINGMVSRVAELQEITYESLRAAEDQSSEFTDFSTKAERNLERFAMDMMKQVENLRKRLGDRLEDSEISEGRGLFSRIAALWEEETTLQTLIRQNQDDSRNWAIDEETQLYVRDLQLRTQKLLSQMLGSDSGSSISVYDMQRKLHKYESLLSPKIFDRAITSQMAIALVAFSSEAAVSLEQALKFPSRIESAFVQKFILKRWFQTSVRRRLLMHATSCPYTVEVADNGIGLSIIILDEDVVVEFNDENTKVYISSPCKQSQEHEFPYQYSESSLEALGYSNGDEVNNVFSDDAIQSDSDFDFVRIVLVDFQHSGVGNKRDLVGIRLCSETLEIKDACQAIVDGARNTLTTPIRIV